MVIIGRRTDGVLLVALGGGLHYAVNVPHRRVAPVLDIDGALADLSTWVLVPAAERAQYVPAVRHCLDGPHRRVSLDDVGWGMDEDEEDHHHPDTATEIEPPSMGERQQRLQAALDATVKRRFGSMGSGGGGYPSISTWWIKEVRDQSDPPYIVYCDAEGKHFKWEYHDDAATPQFLGDPRPIEYVPIEV